MSVDNKYRINKTVVTITAVCWQKLLPCISPIQTFNYDVAVVGGRCGPGTLFALLWRMLSTHFTAKSQPFPSFGSVPSAEKVCVHLHERRCLAGEYAETRSVWGDAWLNHTLNTKNNHSASTHPTETQTPDASAAQVPMAEEADFMRSVLPVRGAFHSVDSSLALPQADKLALADAHRLNRLQQQVQLSLSRKRKKPKPPGMWNETAWNKSKYVKKKKKSSVLVWDRIQV